MDDLPTIKFESAEHVIEVIEKSLAETPERLKGIVAAVLSLWKWQQNEWSNETERWHLKGGNNTCGLCCVYWKNKAGECGDCSLAKFGGNCYQSSSSYNKMRSDDSRTKQPLIAALEQAVLYEMAEEFRRRCEETSRKELKKCLK